MVERTDWRYENKMRVSDDTAERAIAWAQTHLTPDPHVDPALGDRYLISSLYFDTPTLAVFNRVGADQRRKYRVRRYGDAPLLCLERKMKADGRVRKFRSWIPNDEIALLEELEGDRRWSGDWFRRRVRFRQLRPVCCVYYERVARVGELGGHKVRVTVDRQISATCTTRFCISAEGCSVPILDREAILELKFPAAMPGPLEELLGALDLVPGSISKYHLAMEACGLTRAEAAIESAADGASIPAICCDGSPAMVERSAPARDPLEIISPAIEISSIAAS
jgi:hypothetical protein